MKKLIVIFAVAFMSCKKEPIPTPIPEPVTYDIKYIVSGDKYTYKYYDPITEQSVISDTVSGEFEVDYTVDNWVVLTLSATPDTNSYVRTVIMVDGVVCDEDEADRDINLISSQSMCNKWR